MQKSPAEALQLSFQPPVVVLFTLKAYFVAPETAFQETVAWVPEALQEPESPLGTEGRGQEVGVGVEVGPWVGVGVRVGVGVTVG